VKETFHHTEEAMASANPPWIVFLDSNKWIELARGHYGIAHELKSFSRRDQITGSVSWISSGCNGNGTGGSGYLMNTEDNTLNQAVFLYAGTSNQAITAVASVFEAWNLNSCNQLPRQSTDTFSSISVSPSVTNWSVGLDTSDSPQCNYNIYDAVIHFHSYPTTDVYSRSHGMSIDSSLVAPWWPLMVPSSSW
jgi:hypothetical protein